MIISKNKITYVFSFFISLCYAYAMSSLSNDLFRDRDNYIIYAIKSENILDNYVGLSLFTNEPFFLLFNKFLGFIADPEIVPKIFVFFICFSLSFFIFYRCKNILIGLMGFIALLCAPQVFHLELVILRQGAAACILLWVTYLFWNSKYYLLFVFLIGFMHSSTFIIFSFLLADKMFSLYITNKIYYRCLMLFFLSMGIGIIILPMAELLSMRQAEEYSQAELSVGGGNFILYAGVLLMLLTQKRVLSENDSIYIIAVLGLSIYLGMYFFSPFSGRLIATFIPFIIFALCSFANARAYMLLLFYIIVNGFIFLPTIMNNSLTVAGVTLINAL